MVAGADEAGTVEGVEAGATAAPDALGLGEATVGLSARAAGALDVVSDGSDGPSFAPTSRGQPTPMANPTMAMTPTRTQEG
jgi:hypothetical protein